MELIRIFKQLDKNDVALAGGKGASLGEMTGAGIAVPPGFVILSTAFEKFLEETDLNVEIDAALDSVNNKEIHTVENASERIQALILGAEMPKDIAKEIKKCFKNLGEKYVAVRSSATAEDSASAAWAGQLESYLNTTEKNLLENVKKCWASLFTPRAIFYRFEMHGEHNSPSPSYFKRGKSSSVPPLKIRGGEGGVMSHDKISVAVVVQKMVESEVSGIAFSVHPVTQDRNQLIIEAGFGLGEAIVSGQITPDSYVVEKEPRRIIDKNVQTQSRGLYRAKNSGNEWRDIPKKIGEKQVLSDKEIEKLSKIILRIENHYGFPVDVEWAFEKRKFYIVQSRPITTLSKNNGDRREKKFHFEKDVTRDLALLVVEGFEPVLIKLYKKLKGTAPASPFMVFYVRDLLIEEWLESNLLQELTELIFLENLKDSSFLEKGVANYKKHLNIYQDSDITSLEELKKYLHSLHLALESFIIFYLTAGDARTPKTIFELAKKVRDADKLGDTADKTVRFALKNIFPYAEDYETVISSDDLSRMPDTSVLTERAKQFLFVPGKFSEIISLENFSHKHPEYHFHIETPSTNNQRLTGQIGNKGYAKGKVRIVNRKKEISSVQNGDILVSTMTTPSFVPAMRKAAAFITDEGGITCHAAIIAREMNKPCIIGTKFATQILKDGDMVEVDADKGVVRILKRNEIDDQREVMVSHQSDLLTQDLILSGIYERCRFTDYGLGFDFPLIRYEHESGDISYPAWQVNELKILELSSEDLSRLKNFLEKELSEYKKFLNDFKKQITTKDNALHKIKTYFEKSKKGASTIPYFALEMSLNKKLEEEGVSLKDIPSSLTDTSLASQELEKIFTRFKREKEKSKQHLPLTKALRAELNNFCDRFGYLGMIYFKGNPWTVSDAYKMLFAAQTKKQKKEKMRKKLSKIVTIASDLLRLRTQKWELMCYGCYLFRKFIKQYFSDVVVYEDLLNLRIGEVIHIIERKRALEDMGRSRKFFLLEITPKGVILSTAKKMDSETTVRDENIKEIRGVVAQPGKAMGEAKIILSSKDGYKLNNGDILITKMSTPDFLPIMKKASAFVTDIGGITSHAAIVSREMNKPCIIGTKVATRVLKDGDLVEVDADNGVVRILSQAPMYKHVWIKTFSRPHTIQRISFIWNYFKGGIPQNRNIQMNELLILPSDKKYDYYIHEDEWMKCLEQLSAMILGVDTDEQEKDLERVADDWKAKAEKIHNHDISKWSDNELITWFKNFSASYSKFTFYSLTPWSIDFVLAPRLFEILNSRNPKKANHWFEAISTPTRYNRMTQQRIDLLKISISGNKNNLGEHTKKYFWLPVYNLGDKPWTEDDFEKHLNEIKNPEEELRKITEDFKKRKINYAEVLKEIKPDKKLRNLIEVVHLYTFLRDERADHWRIGLYYIYPFYLEVAKRADIAIEDAINLLDEEIVVFLKNGKLPPEYELRKNKHAIIFRNGVTRVFVHDEEIHQLQERELGKLNKEGITELRGLSAYKGVARGMARIIRQAQDLTKLKKGEILVAHHTSPEYVIAIKKASAIVTDEGGITSHAAIVSRELKIPCVTATHDGSSVIKTGDTIEVDADKGVVKIFKKMRKK